MKEFLASPLAIILYIVVFYIVGQIIGRKTDCVVLHKSFDAWVLTIMGWSIILMLILGGIMQNEEGDMSLFRLMFWSVISILCLILVITSVIANLGHGWLSVLYIVVSILMKSIFATFSPLNSLIMLCVMFSGKDDARYRDGTKGNGKTINLWRFFDIFNFLVFDLIKPEKEKWRFVSAIFHKAGANYED